MDGFPSLLRAHLGLVRTSVERQERPRDADFSSIPGFRFFPLTVVRCREAATFLLGKRSESFLKSYKDPRAPIAPPLPARLPAENHARVKSSTAPISGYTMICASSSPQADVNVLGSSILGFIRSAGFWICEIQPNEDHRKCFRPQLTRFELVGDPLKTFVKTLTRGSASGLDVLFVC